MDYICPDRQGFSRSQWFLMEAESWTRVLGPIDTTDLFFVRKTTALNIIEAEFIQILQQNLQCVQGLS